MTYTPDPVQQGDGSIRQWLNCTCASGATLLDRDTVGADTTTGARVRVLTGDTSGGTNLVQVDNALRAGWPPDDHLDNRPMMAFDDAIDEVAGGRGCVVQGGYDGGFAGTDLDGSPGFHGNHAIYWNAVVVVHQVTGWIVDYDASRAQIYDPLWDGRRPGIPSKMFRWVKLSVVRQFCAWLMLDSGNRLGVGRGYFGFSRDTEPTVPKPQPVVPTDFGENTMIVAGGLSIISDHVMLLKQGQSIYRSPKIGAPVVTKMSKAAKVDYIGNAATGWRAVVVQTANFSDGVKRPVVGYVPASAGSITSR